MRLNIGTKGLNILYRACLAAVILLGIIFRVLFAINVPTEQMYDFAAYKELAVNIKDGLGHTLSGFPVAWQGPLYPYLLGFFFRILGDTSDMTGKVLNIILSSLTMVMSVPVYSGLFKGRPSMIFAAVTITALLPVNIAYVNVLGTETLFVFLLFAIMFIQFHFSNRIVFYILIGILTGLAALTKPFMTAFPAALTLAYWFQNKDWRKTIIYAAVVTICTFAVIAPWTFRNYKYFGRFIPVSYNGGYVTFINNNDKNQNGLWMDVQKVDESLSAEINKITEYYGNAGVKGASGLEPLLSRQSGEWIRENFGEFLKLGFLRLNETFFSNSHDLAQWAMNGAEYATERDKNAVETGLTLVNRVLSVAGLLFVLTRIGSFFKGFLPGRQVSMSDMFSFVFFVFFVVIVFASEGQARYAVPAYPFMVYMLIKLLDYKTGCDIINRSENLEGDKL